MCSLGDALDASGQVLGHHAGLDRLDAHLFERIRKLAQRAVAVELGSVRESARPREDRS